MPLIDKNIVITPNTGSASNPTIVFSGADTVTGPQNITLTVTHTNSGTLTFSGASATPLTVTGNGRILVNGATDNGSSSLQVGGNITSSNKTTGSVVVTGGLGVSGDVHATNFYSNGTLVAPGLSRNEAIAFSITLGS